MSESEAFHLPKLPSLVSPNTIHLETKGRSLSFQGKHLFYWVFKGSTCFSPLSGCLARPVPRLSAHLVTMCGSANEDFPEWVTISSDCRSAFLAGTKVQDRGGGEREPITLSPTKPNSPLPLGPSPPSLRRDFWTRCKQILSVSPPCVSLQRHFLQLHSMWQAGTHASMVLWTTENS